MTPPAATSQGRSKLLDAAMTLVRTRGYSATTVDDICSEAGVTKGSFFHHFDTKEDLAIAAAEHFASMAAGLFESAPYRHATDPLDRLLGYVDFRIAILRGSLPQFTCLLGTMVQEVYHTNPRIRKACDLYISAHAGELMKDIEEAKRLYAPKAPWTVESVAFFTQAAIQGSFILAKAKNKPDIAVECVKHLRRYLEFLFAHPNSKENHA